MSLKVWLVAIGILLEARRFHDEFKNTLDVSIKHRHIKRAVFDSGHNVLVLLGISWLKHVIAGTHLRRRIIAAEPVSHYHSLETPFITQQCRKQFGVLGSIRTVYVVIR